MEEIKRSITDEELQKLKRAAEDRHKERFEEAFRPESVGNRHARRKAKAMERVGG